MPLLPEAPAPTPAARLNPPVDIAGVRHLVVTQYADATHVRKLGERAAKLASYYDSTVAALDLLIIGAWAPTERQDSGANILGLAQTSTGLGAAVKHLVTRC